MPSWKKIYNIFSVNLICWSICPYPSKRNSTNTVSFFFVSGIATIKVMVTWQSRKCTFSGFAGTQMHLSGSQTY